ncbi:DNA-protecting protein DprA [Rhodococcus triatomae]|uniref:DNA processing protein n=1 Tax=Rhodococcus triatomae TaxID=300028 RepID=A0A1G8Q114_9NOCA|nr:DNA-processing protein DprA [Rhodococcus triatomae]QNG19207.1 DNA-protecting protein DprA [Rhodococcus triatomae]QNG24880.1 DNA-protecting protein DprA [Rhodococcus triatomae]SDI98449.1 DNA processing protein [Rhodococcus triatomae]
MAGETEEAQAVPVNHDPRRLAWAYLARVVQGPSPQLARLVADNGPEEVARAVRAGALPDELVARTAARAQVDTAASDLDVVAALGGRLVTPEDDEWPQWRFLAFAGVEREAGAGEPFALWVVGSRPLAELTDRAVGIVGTRAASSYGEHVTGEIAGDLAVDGWTVVSGAAFGIDGAAHRAALGVGGTTIAVLACGIDRAYPAGHARLLRQIAREGAVVSEYPPGTSPARYRFLARNRLVAAMSDGVVVVEAGWRSGARNTAAWARKLGRPVMAVPGPVTAASSTGCNRMIREGEAALVTCAGDVVEVAGPIELRDELPMVASRDTDVLTGDVLLVYEALPASGTRGTGELSVESGVPIERVRASLPLLELEGFVGLGDTGWFRRT